MLRKTFGDFINKKKRDAVKHLELIEKLLKKQGMKVEKFFEDADEPYVFCFNPTKNTSFDGVRIYTIAGQIAFRVQKESKTHPYGRAYPLNIEEMFEDFLTDEGINEQEAGKKVIEAVNKEVRRFFEKCVDAEKDDRQQEKEDEAEGGIAIRGQNTDYSNLINNKGN